MIGQRVVARSVRPIAVVPPADFAGGVRLPIDEANRLILGWCAESAAAISIFTAAATATATIVTTTATATAATSATTAATTTTAGTTATTSTRLTSGGLPIALNALITEFLVALIHKVRT